MKLTLVIDKDGKIILDDLPKNLPPGEYDCTVSKNILFSVGTNEPKRVTFLNKTLYREFKSVLNENVYEHMSHIGWYSLGKLIDHIEENYHIEKKEVPDAS